MHAMSTPKHGVYDTHTHLLSPFAPCTCCTEFSFAWEAGMRTGLVFSAYCSCAADKFGCLTSRTGEGVVLCTLHFRILCPKAWPMRLWHIRHHLLLHVYAAGRLLWSHRPVSPKCGQRRQCHSALPVKSATTEEQWTAALSLQIACLYVVSSVVSTQVLLCVKVVDPSLHS